MVRKVKKMEWPQDPQEKDLKWYMTALKQNWLMWKSGSKTFIFPKEPTEAETTKLINIYKNTQFNYIKSNDTRN